MRLRPWRGGAAAWATLGALVVVSACSNLLGINGDRTLATSDSGIDAVAIDGAADAPKDDAIAINPSVARDRADDAVQSMLLRFWDGNLFRETPGPESPEQIAATGSVTQAWNVVLDAVVRHGGTRFAGSLRTFFDVQTKAGWSSYRYDDASATTLALLRAYDFTGDTSYLFQARVVYQGVVTAWDSLCCVVTPSGIGGGVWHDRAQSRKSTAANATAVIAGARLYERTKFTSYLAFAKQVYGYWSANMVDPVSHQVWDGVTSIGVQRNKYSYDQGLMIGAAVALAHADPSSAAERIAEAHGYARFLMTDETGPSPSGTILSDGEAAMCELECAQYKGIAARHLAELYVADPSHTEYQALLVRSAASVWDNARQAKGLYGADWASTTSTPTLSSTASAATALAVVASLNPAPVNRTNTYEAEEGTIHGVLLEAEYAPFFGWGYVAGWGCLVTPLQDPQGCVQAQLDGQGVDLVVTAPFEGEYDLTLRYSASAGATPDGGDPTTIRALSVNHGAMAIDQVPFVATQDWSKWRTVGVPSVPLHTGSNSLSVFFDTARGSFGWLNLDQITVAECPRGTRPNLLKQQPAPSDWGPTFEAPFAMTVVDQLCGESVVHWVNPKIQAHNWIKIFPNLPPFRAGLVPGQSYLASITMRGSGRYLLDVWDGQGDGGVGDNQSGAVDLGNEPRDLTVPFRMGTGSEPQLQVRIEGPGPQVDVDVTLWHVAIYAN